MPTYVPLSPLPFQYQDSTTSLNMNNGTIEFFLAGTSTPTNLFSDNTGTSIGTSITLNSGGYPESGGNVITLFKDSDIDYKLILKNAAGTIVSTSDNIPSLATSLTQTQIATILNPQTARESAVSASIVDFTKEVGNVLRYQENTTPGTTDMSAGFQAALNVVDGFGGTMYIPEGEYLINTKLTFSEGQFSVKGAGIRQSVLTSGVIGDSLWGITDSPNSVYFSDFECDGNNLTGASGNGHCFNFIDPTIGTAPNTPQLLVMERVFIKNFRGTDVEGTAATTIEACGICHHDGLGNVYRDVEVRQCGRGFYFRETENCRLDTCVSQDCDVAALYFYQNENMVVSNCDILNSGDGNAITVPVSTGSHSVVCFRNENLVFFGNKFKNYEGDAMIGIYNEMATNFIGCRIRGTKTTAGANKGIYAELLTGLYIQGCEFAASNDGLTGDYEHIELVTDSANNPFSNCSIKNNTFKLVNKDTEYAVYAHSNTGSNRRFTNLVIEQNVVGDESGSSNTNAIATAFKLENAIVDGGRMMNNTVYADSDTTVTLGYEVDESTTTLTDFKFEGNKVQSNGGTVTAEFSPVRVIDSENVPLIHETVDIETTGAQAGSLADGWEGQKKTVYMSVDGGDYVLTPANLVGGTTITFDDASDVWFGQFLGGSWHTIGGTATVA